MAAKKPNPTQEDLTITSDASSEEVERIVDELIESEPRLKAARENLRATDRGESIAHRSLRGFRQGLKK